LKPQDSNERYDRKLSENAAKKQTKSCGETLIMIPKPIHISFVFIILFIWPLSLSEAGSIEPDKKSRLIILPLQPEKTIESDGTGLGVHFLLGNVIAVHTGLKEFWFGWRMTKLFRGKNHLHAYCRGNEQLPNIARLGEDQQTRYWIEGTYKRKQGMIFLALNLFDILNPDQKNMIQIPLDTRDHLIGFRKLFLAWLEKCGLPISKEQSDKAMWPEKITPEGLDFLGRALEKTYHGYFAPKLDENYTESLMLFDKALAQCPESYLIHDMKGWAFYKNKDYIKALTSFQTAVELNKNGLGALSGMMYCHICLGNQTKAIKFAQAKADVRNASYEKITKFVIKKMNSLK
jgi:tetratricopeptide (TPR) repeat protein